MMPSVMQTLDSDKQLIITVTNKANSKNVIEKKKLTINSTKKIYYSLFISCKSSNE